MSQSPHSLRQMIRAKQHKGATAGLAPSFVQVNVVVIPEQYAYHFLQLCQANPKPCPLIAVSDVGGYTFPEIARDADIRTDIPAYQIYEKGQLCETRHDVVDIWQDDFVTFLLGCSFSFEQALLDNGITLRHHDQGKNVSMYETNLPLKSAGVFGGNMVVSMRPMRAHDAIKAIQITTAMPRVHGAPIHLGSPELIGISHIEQPDYGDAVTINHDELPVFWACGVTAMVAVKAAKLPLAITHSPGCMLITDLYNHQLFY